MGAQSFQQLYLFLFFILFMARSAFALPPNFGLIAHQVSLLERQGARAWANLDTS